jgi:hypothetical protein
MSAIGPKQTYRIASHMSAFGGKADMALCENPLSRSLLGAKRTYPFALHMSAFDPKRTYKTAVGLPLQRGKTAVSLSQIQPTPLYGRASFIPRSSADLRFYVSVAIGHPR